MSVEVKDISLPAIFAINGLRAGSRNWRDYEEGKRIVADVMPDDYERGIEELAAYLCL